MRPTFPSPHPPPTGVAPLSIGALDPRAYRRTTADRVEQFAFRSGRSYDAYLANEPDRELFWSRDVAPL
jgi:hypothetical protein